MKKQKSTSKLKKELDAVFSKYIRLRYADKLGYCRCATCGVKKHWKELQCGHFVPRNYLNTRWLIQNCMPQCVGCNYFGKGKPVQMADKIRLEFGDACPDNLYTLARIVAKFTKFDYERMIDEYKVLVKEIEK